jgi:hypothetical protein
MEKDQMEQVCPSSINALHNLSLKVVIPPGLKGYAGPMMMIFLEWNTDDTDWTDFPSKENFLLV